jgi:hypothetical protein
MLTRLPMGTHPNISLRLGWTVSAPERAKIAAVL